MTAGNQPRSESMIPFFRAESNRRMKSCENTSGIRAVLAFLSCVVVLLAGERDDVRCRSLIRATSGFLPILLVLVVSC